ncbi:MAG: hypothetical protein K9L62_04365 [Vallitaleaceae bacterium]|nr:hypothetical protein [Vallitaleaceae bacterium]
MKKSLLILLFLICLWLSSISLFAATPTTVSQLMDEIKDDKMEASYDIKLNAPFTKETSGIMESINPETGEVVVRNTIFYIPGRNGKDLNIELVYSSRDAKLYDEGTKSVSIPNNYGQEIIAIYDVYDNNGFWLKTSGLKYPTSETTILAETILDNQNWVFTGYLEYENGTDLITSGSIVNVTKEKGYTSTSKDMFGEGWSLDIPKLEIDGQENIYVALLNGQTYKADFSAGVGLKDYMLGNVVFTKDTTRRVGEDISAYKLYYANGDAYYYTAAGELIMETDKFNNMIVYHWKNVNNKRLIVKIIDTIGRAVDINYSDSVTSFTSGEKTVRLIKSPVPGVSGKYYLSSFIDAAGRETFYNYEFKQASFDSINSTPAYNTLVTLKEIHYPTGLKTVYNFTRATKNFGTSGSMDYYKVINRYELDKGSKCNTQIYNYYNEPDGFPSIKDSVIPESYKYYTEMTDGKGLTTRFQYDNKHQLVLKQQIKDVLLFESRISYNTISKLPERYDNKTYNEDGKYMLQTNLVKYDFRGNLVEENHTDNNTVPISNERKVTYGYSYAYNLLTKKSYKQDEDTRIEINYNLSEDGKTVESESLLANGSRVSYIKYTYDNFGNIISLSREKDPGEWFITRYLYDNRFQNAYMTSIIFENVNDSDGNKKSIVVKNDYEKATGNKINSTDENGNITRYEYDALSRLTKEILPDGLTRKYQYDDTNNQISVTDANGNNLSYHYDSLGKLIKVLEPTQNLHLAKFEYDEDEALLNSYDGNNGLKSYTYDERNRIASVIQHDSKGILLKKVDVSYDDVFIDRFENNYLKITLREKGDYKDRIQAYYYDNYERLVMQSRMVNGNEEFAFYKYDYLGNLIESIDFSGDRTLSVYNPLGLITKSINPDGYEMIYDYDGLNNVASITDALGSTIHYNYNELGRLITQKTPYDVRENSVVKNYYDDVGNLTKTVDPEGYMTKYLYNTRNQLSAVEQVINSDKSNIVKYGYDGEGNITSIHKGLSSWVDSEFTSHFYKFDHLNRLSEMTDASNRSTFYQYDNNGNLIEKTDRNNITTFFRYDGLNRLVEKKNSKDGLKTAVNLTYGLLGEILKVSDASGEAVFDYDELGRLIFTNYQNGIRKSYQYDDGGRVSNFRVMQGGLESINLNYEYDKMGRLIHLNENGQQYIYKYDAVGKLLEEENTVTGLKSSYTYYPSGTLKSLANYTFGELDSLFNYKYNKRGYETEKDENGVLTKYHYDSLGRLKTAELPEGQIQDYIYDDLSNRSKLVEINGKYIKETMYHYDKDNRLLFSEQLSDDSLTELRYEYDLEGNLQKSLETYKYNNTLMAEKEFDYQYNGLNQLQRVIDPMEMIYDYTYDWQGLRTKKSYGYEAINYINEGGNIILETDKDMKIVARNIRGNKLIYRETNITDLESTYLGYIYNRHGDIIGLTDKKGSIVKRYNYSPFGEEKVSASNGFGDSLTTLQWANEVEDFDNPFRYAGEYFDKETDNIYLRARYYDPGIGRFTQQDGYEYMKYEDPLSLNLYTYCHNNPLTYIDPSGHYIDTALDAGFITYDIKQLIKNPKSIENWAAFFADIAGAALPVVTGAGAGVRAGFKITDKNMDLMRIADKAADNGKVLNKGGTASGADNIATGAKLKEFYRQAEKYGTGSIKELESGKFRFYGDVKAAAKEGEMAGARLVREWDPATGATRTWYETVDHAGNIRQVRPNPDLTGGVKTHYMFDVDGNYTGSWIPKK